MHKAFTALPTMLTTIRHPVLQSCLYCTVHAAAVYNVYQTLDADQDHNAESRLCEGVCFSGQHNT